MTVAPAAMAWSAAHRAADQARASFRCDRQDRRRGGPRPRRTSAFAVEGVVFAPGGKPLAVIELGVELLAVQAQAVRPGQHAACPVLRARAEGGDRPVRPQAHGPGGQEGVQPPVKPDRYRVPVPAGLRHRVGERDISPDPAASDAQGGQVQRGGAPGRSAAGSAGSPPTTSRGRTTRVGAGPGACTRSSARPGSASCRSRTACCRSHAARMSVPGTLGGGSRSATPSGRRPCVSQEAGYLAGAGPDDRGREMLPAGHRRPYRLPFLRRPLAGVGRPGRDDRAGEAGPPARRAEDTPGLLLRHPDDAVIDRDAIRRGAAPAQAAQRHPSRRWQRPSQPVLSRGKHLDVACLPVPGHQPVGDAFHEGRAPRDPLRDHWTSERLAGLLVGPAADQHAGAGGAGRLLAGEGVLQTPP